MTTSRAPRVVLIALAVCAACQSSTASRSAPRVYVLEAIDGRPMPAVLSASVLDTTTVLADSLTLDGAGRASRVRLLRHAVIGAGTREDTVTDRYDYQITGDSIVLRAPCGDPLNACPHGEIGMVSGSSMVLVADIRPITGPVLQYGLSRTL